MTELHLITGGAGCIGSELASALLSAGHQVRVIDNLSSGRRTHIEPYLKDYNFEFIQGDLRDWRTCNEAIRGAYQVWHLTAKTDIKFLGHYDFDADYKQNLEVTWQLLDRMMHHGVKRIAFASSAAVYGEATVLDEDVILPSPVSMYGATKLACEAIIRAIALRCDMKAWMFRYCSIVSGKARTGGNMVIPDFIHKLKRDPTRLEIYGDGNQTKPSLHVSECVEAMRFIVQRAKEQVSLYNIGAYDAISVTRQAEIVCQAMGLSRCPFTNMVWEQCGCGQCQSENPIYPEFAYTGGKGGWPGDVPSFRMRTNKLASLGWRARMNSEQACRLAIAQLLESGE